MPAADYSEDFHLQGALNGAGATLFGLGSDIGGSIRIPSLFCGIFGHKPTGGVVSVEGHFPSDDVDDEFAQSLVLGPMTRFASDLGQLLQIMIEPEQAMRLRLDEPVQLKELQVHYAYGFPGLNGSMHHAVDSDIQYAIGRAVEHLKSSGLTVRPAELGGFSDSLEIGMAGIARLRQMQYILPEGNVRSTLGQLLRSVCGCGESKYTRDALIFDLMRRTNAFMGVQRLQHYRREGQRLAEELSVSKSGAISSMHELPNPRKLCFVSHSLSLSHSSVLATARRDGRAALSHLAYGRLRFRLDPVAVVGRRLHAHLQCARRTCHPCAHGRQCEGITHWFLGNCGAQSGSSLFASGG